METPTPESTPAETFLIGLMAILPLVLTVVVIVWVAGLLDQLLGLPKA